MEVLNSQRSNILSKFLKQLYKSKAHLGSLSIEDKQIIILWDLEIGCSRDLNSKRLIF